MSDIFGLKNKKIVITGAAQGIGEATAMRFSECGAQLILCDINVKGLEKLQARIIDSTGTRCECHVGNVSKEDVVDAAFEFAIAEFGDVDIVVCNVGAQSYAPTHEMSHAQFLETLDVNLSSVFLPLRWASRYWISRRKKGVIVVTSSAHEKIPKPGYIAYSASKGGVGNIVRTAALEFASSGIRVNGVAPGAIVTPMNAEWAYDEHKKAEVSAHIPMRRPGAAGEVADLIVFLASNRASYITGETVYVDGGLSLYADFARNWSS
ncbi:MAG: SDR family NAD(P)-dependent oxidoreductase [Segniliparus sp.]|uniref:SDR family NAD(P)-dependent oxidoreductase n=1 Tax=Segniliparus sp. TaxID=2804064 RepID=UPI003F3822C2